MLADGGDTGAEAVDFGFVQHDVEDAFDALSEEAGGGVEADFLDGRRKQFNWLLARFGRGFPLRHGRTVIPAWGNAPGIVAMNI